MAGFSSRILFTSTSTLVVILTFFWYLRKKKVLSVQQSVDNIEDNQFNIPKSYSVSGNSFMNLKEHTGESTLAQQASSVEKISAEKMHLKGESQSTNGTGISDKSATQMKLNGNNDIYSSNHVHENSTTCDKTTCAITNGTSHSKGDNILDKKTYSTSEVNNSFNSSETNGFGNISKLSNGIKSLSINKNVVEQVMFNRKESTIQTHDIGNKKNDADQDAFNGNKSQESCNTKILNEIDNLKDSAHAISCSSGSDNSVLEAELSQNEISDKTSNYIDESSSTSKFSLSANYLTHDILEQSDEASTNTNTSHTLSCDTNFERKTLTPDSGVTGELQESDSASSTISDHLSDYNSNGIHSDVLKSPSVSESSNDSGKDSSENHFEDQGVVGGGEKALYSYQQLEDDFIHYDFAIPQKLCGYLIGRNGRHVRYLIEETNASINIGLNPFMKDYKICTISGTEDEVKHALTLIREKFPVEKHPELSLESLNPIQAECTLPVTIKLTLPEGVNFDAILSSTITPGHFFLQQPTHPTYHTLSWLSQAMTTWYNSCETPKLFKISVGNVVAAPMCGGWYRAEVTDFCPETDECSVKFLDFGGYCTLTSSDLRQMKVEYAYIPFQAVECYLGNVTYPTGQDDWSDEAKRVFEDLAQGQILQGYIIGYEEGIPYVHLYKVQGASTIFINRELVNRQLAQWQNHEPDA